MKLKRGYGVFLLAYVFVLACVSLVAADLVDVFDRGAQGLDPALRYIIGDVGSGELLFIKLLVFVLLIAIISFSLRKASLFEGNTAVVNVVSIIVSLIAIRFITSDQLVNFIWLPYGGLGVLLSSILPFIIFFFFVESFDTSLIRRVGWVAFVCIYLGLAIMRWDTFAVGGDWWQNLAVIYVAIAVLSLLIAIFDKAVRSSMMMAALERGLDVDKVRSMVDLKKNISRDEDRLSSTTTAYERKRLLESIRDNKAKLKSLSKT